MSEGYKELREFLTTLSGGPDSQIDAVYTKEIKDFLALPDSPDPVVFTRNLLDKMVFTSGCSDAVVMIISGVLSPWVEDEEAKAARRKEIKI